MLRHFDLSTFRRTVWPHLSGLGFGYHHAFAAETWITNHIKTESDTIQWPTRLILCLLMEARDRGHVCMPLAAIPTLLASRSDGESMHSARVPGLPDLQQAQSDTLAQTLLNTGIALLESPVAHETPTVTLLRTDADGWWLYLSSDGQAEAEVAELLLNKTSESATNVVSSKTSTGLLDWFASLPVELAPSTEQVAAVLKAIPAPLYVLSGGPGTGKTSTVFHILRALCHRFLEAKGELPSIALAAPTGRAAARMREALVTTSEKLDPWLQSSVDQKIGALLMGLEGSTLHRLLGISGSFRGPISSAPLPFELIVVDEASMVDLHLMKTLLRRTGPHTKLILVGDHNQLPSVESGAVLAELISPYDADLESPISSARLTTFFRSRRAILDSSLAVLNGTADKLLENTDADSPDLSISFIEKNAHSSAQFDRMIESWVITNGMREICHSCITISESSKDSTLGEIFDRAQRQIMLSPFHGGQYGVDAINKAVIAKLSPDSVKGKSLSGKMFAGLLVMATQNDYDRGFFNGDRGIIYNDGLRLRAWFPRSKRSATVDPIPSSIPGLVAAFATTIHKSQGSEYDRVLLCLSDSGSKEGHVCRELLYTGMTRARNHLTLAIDREAFKKACENRALRWTRLAQRIADTNTPER